MSPSISGTPSEWFRNGENLLVRFGLNVADAEARQRNERARLEMLSDAQVSAAPGRSFAHVVAVSRGAALSIQIRSRAEPGFGFRIATGADPVVDRLYAVDQADAAGFRNATVRRFQHDARLITVDLMRARQGVHDLQTLERLWACDISTWRVHQFLDPVAGRVFTADHPRFPRQAPRVAAASAAMAARQIPAALQAEHPVRAGVVWADGAAEQRFDRIQVQREDDPDQTPIGLLRVHFFVLDEN
ncbi:hypothetical protein [Marilutibacter alkalisoli]|uniref:Uncharacterized protein n=1 Tax=Marilutibacter alkalisoli TaxID=2591633 RepID=A0A514BNW8_9GAMM|nr:hypothetical protein [Lysobacter alkalisoli]QDH69081.1 hypothetical protein FKV23_02410 [Lysobacter alkalisoli]